MGPATHLAVAREALLAVGLHHALACGKARGWLVSHCRAPLEGKKEKPTPVSRRALRGHSLMRTTAAEHLLSLQTAAAPSHTGEGAHGYAQVAVRVLAELALATVGLGTRPWATGSVPCTAASVEQEPLFALLRRSAQAPRSSALPATSGRAVLPATASCAALPATAGSPALQATAGCAALPATASSSALPATAGRPVMPVTAGCASRPERARLIAGDDMVARRHGGYALAHALHDACGRTQAGTHQARPCRMTLPAVPRLCDFAQKPGMHAAALQRSGRAVWLGLREARGHAAQPHGRPPAASCPRMQGNRPSGSRPSRVYASWLGQRGVETRVEGPQPVLMTLIGVAVCTAPSSPCGTAPWPRS
jgi:hypothetical protein